MKLPLCASLAMLAGVFVGNCAAAQGLPAPAAFCLDHPSACGPCPNRSKNQIDLTIRKPPGETTRNPNRGRVVLNGSGNKVCGGHYMRMQGPAQTGPH